MKEKTGVALESDDVYMNTTFEGFIREMITKSRGGGVAELEYDAVSYCGSPSSPFSLKARLIGQSYLNQIGQN